jgi:hypothetical protein
MIAESHQNVSSLRKYKVTWEKKLIRYRIILKHRKRIDDIKPEMNPLKQQMTISEKGRSISYI